MFDSNEIGAWIGGAAATVTAAVAFIWLWLGLMVPFITDLSFVAAWVAWILSGLLALIVAGVVWALSAVAFIYIVVEIEMIVFDIRHRRGDRDG